MLIYGKNLVIRPCFDGETATNSIDEFISNSGVTQNVMRSPFGIIENKGAEVDADVAIGDKVFIAVEMARDIMDGTYLIHQDFILANMGAGNG